MGPVREFHGLHRHRGAAIPVQALQGRDTLPGNQGHIPAQNHDRAGLGRHRRHGHLHGVAGTLLGLLDRKSDPFPRQGRHNFLSLITHHHQDIGHAYRFESINEIGDHGPSQDLMQHLGMTGFHAGPLPRGQEDGGGVHGFLYHNHLKIA